MTKINIKRKAIETKFSRNVSNNMYKYYLLNGISLKLAFSEHVYVTTHVSFIRMVKAC